MASRWVCPDCPAKLVDAPAALEHEQRLGHGVPALQRPEQRRRAVTPVAGQLELPIG